MAEPSQAVLSVAVAVPVTTETLVVAVEDEPLPVRELAGDLGGRYHVVDLTPGPVTVTYDATLEPSSGGREVTEVERLRALATEQVLPVRPAGSAAVRRPARRPDARAGDDLGP